MDLRGGLINAIGHPHAVSRGRAQVRAGHTCSVQPGHGLIQVRADPADQTGCPDKLGQGLPLQLTDRGCPVLCSVKLSPDDVGGQRQSGPVCRRRHNGQLSLR